MTDVERYHQKLDHCTRMAAWATTDEVRETWLIVEGNYRFLLKRAERTARESQPA